MKSEKLFGLLLPLGLLVLTSCGGQSSRESSGTTICRYHCTDPALISAYRAEEEASLDTQLSIEFMEGNSPLAQSVNDYIVETMNVYTPGKPVLDDPSVYVEFCGLQIQDSLRKVNAVDSLPLEFSLDISCAYTSARFLTYVCNQYSYGGGAHGGTYISATTFRKSDGQRMDDLLLKPSVCQEGSADNRAFKRLLCDSLKLYFAQGGEPIVSDEELLDCLFIGGDWKPDSASATDFLLAAFPLPVVRPAVFEGGIGFTYQQYEIAAYAAGLPEAVFSPADMQPFLTEEAKQLF